VKLSSLAFGKCAIVGTVFCAAGVYESANVCEARVGSEITSHIPGIVKR
jgi:hypothetical protein